MAIFLRNNKGKDDETVVVAGCSKVRPLNGGDTSTRPVTG